MARLASNLRLPLPRLAEVSLCPEAGGGELVALTDEDLFEATGTRIAFTSRQGGASGEPYASLNLSYTVGDDPAAVDENVTRLCAALEVADARSWLVTPKQVHGDRFYEVDELSKSHLDRSPESDGILCTVSNIPVLLCFADCVPVILVAPTGDFAVIHSGWRGSIASIAGQGLDKLAKATGCSPSDINCYIGPHIGSCCYEVNGQLIRQFVAEFGEACAAPDDHLDLTAAVRASLLRVGASEERIAAPDICTSCLVDSFFSYRAEHGITGRHGAFAIRKEHP